MWLVTGGAGYIGAHVVAALAGSGHEVAVLDDLSTGDPRRLPEEVPLVRADVTDPVAVRGALGPAGPLAGRVRGVVHCAARKRVDESVEDPLGYWQANVEGFRVVLAAAVEHNVGSVLLSSSASVYGPTEADPIAEDEPPLPASPYGDTKLACERMLAAVGVATGLRWAALRYFNVVGARAAGFADPFAQNLVPRALRAMRAGEPPLVFGTDYPTRDGTCVRDYVHVLDVADAHVAAADALAAGRVGAEVLNLGRGEGSTVLEVLAAVGRALDRPVEPRLVGRRPGDPPVSRADPARAHRLLGWRARHDLDAMVRSEAAATAEPLAERLC